MLIVLTRTIILFVAVVMSMRIMGKRQIGQLQPYELVIAIMLSELASLPMQDTRIPLIHGIIPLVTLPVLQIIISIWQLKSEKFREIICGKPSILINNGLIDIKQLRYQRFNINDLMEELRLQGYINIQDIQFAILETSGQLSVIPKTTLTPITKEDINIKALQEYLPITLILDGKVNENNLKMINKDRYWIMNELKKHRIARPEDVFIAVMNSKHAFYYQLKGGKKIKS